MGHTFLPGIFIPIPTLGCGLPARTSGNSSVNSCIKRSVLPLAFTNLVTKQFLCHRKWIHVVCCLPKFPKNWLDCISASKKGPQKDMSPRQDTISATCLSVSWGTITNDTTCFYYNFKGHIFSSQQSASANPIILDLLHVAVQVRLTLRYDLF